MALKFLKSLAIHNNRKCLERQGFYVLRRPRANSFFFIGKTMKADTIRALFLVQGVFNPGTLFSSTKIQADKEPVRQSTGISFEVFQMCRSLFLAIGLFICLIGVECLFVETAVFTNADFADVDPTDPIITPTDFVISPPDWAPWGLLAGGSVVMIYSFTIPSSVRR